MSLAPSKLMPFLLGGWGAAARGQGRGQGSCSQPGVQRPASTGLQQGPPRGRPGPHPARSPPSHPGDQPACRAGADVRRVALTHGAEPPVAERGSRGTERGSGGTERLGRLAREAGRGRWAVGGARSGPRGAGSRRPPTAPPPETGCVPGGVPGPALLPAPQASPQMAARAPSAPRFLAASCIVGLTAAVAAGAAAEAGSASKEKAPPAPRHAGRRHTRTPTALCRAPTHSERLPPAVPGSKDAVEVSGPGAGGLLEQQLLWF